MSEQISTLEQPKQLEQAEVDVRFEQIIDLIELNHQLDSDLQADRIEELEAKRDALLAELLLDPVAAFDQEFTLLSRLYEGRTLRDTNLLGTVTDEFVTRDKTRTKADLHFRELHYSSGASERIVEVPGEEPDQLPFFIALKDDTLTVTYMVYRRGQYERVNTEPESDLGKRLLKGFLTHSITASDLVFNRTSDEITAADMQARSFLSAKRRQD